MSTWWNIDKYAYKIKPVEVTSETPKYITLAASESYFKRPMRVLKGSEYFPTFAEARTFLLDRLASKFSSLEEELERVRKNTDKVFMMEQPK